MKNQTIAIVGGGVNGLLAASLAAKRFPNAQVVLVEGSDSLGGLHKSFDYGQYGQFDHGVHLISQTAIPDIDEVLINSFTNSAWSVPDGMIRELPGAYVHGALQTHLSYIDLRTLSDELYRACMGDLMATINKYPDPTIRRYDNARDYSEHLYGPVITENVIKPIVEKTFHKPIQELDAFVMQLLPLSRMAMFDHDLVPEMKGATPLGHRLCFTEQKRTPDAIHDGKYLFYPRKPGVQRWIDAISRRLNQQGVKIMTSRAVKEIIKNNGHISALMLADTSRPEASLSMLDVDYVIWAAGVHPLAGTLGQFREGDQFDMPLKTVIVNMVLDEPLTNDLHFFYCFEPGFRSIRIGNYATYSKDATQIGGYPICVEMIVPPDEAADIAALEKRAISELEQMGAIQPNASIPFRKVEVLRAGYPMPTAKNINIINIRRDRIRDLGLENLEMIGLMSEESLFFQRPSTIDTWKKINAITLKKPQIIVPIQSGMAIPLDSITSQGKAPSENTALLKGRKGAVPSQRNRLQ